MCKITSPWVVFVHNRTDFDSSDISSNESVFLILFFNYERKALIYGYCFALQYSCSWLLKEIRQDTKCEWYYLGLICGFPLSDKASEVKVDMHTSLRNAWRKGTFWLPLVSKGRYTPCFKSSTLFLYPWDPDHMLENSLCFK